MKIRSLIFALQASTILVGACSEHSEPRDNCGLLNSVPGILLYLSDASTGTLICDAEVKIFDGDFTQTKKKAFDPNACVYTLAQEREGNYTVEVEHVDYRDAQTEVTVQRADECHVKTTETRLMLSRVTEPTH